MNRKKVVVAMSGGVDSSVTAALLKEQGYDVYGITMRLSDRQETEGRKFGGCCGSKDFYDARSVAQTLGIPHYLFDYVEKFRGSVIGYFKDSYLKGETPNPCIACNQHVKFDALLNQATALGADYLATGHYARIAIGRHCEERSDEAICHFDGKGQIASLPVVARNDGKNKYFLKKAVDLSKDQSYVLYGLGQKELSRLLFPLGELTKTEVRDIARKYNLRTADKPDSYEICFVPNEDYRQFISEEVPAAARPTGPIRHVNGQTLGRHKGLPFYTIGQREGLGISAGRPLYVTVIETRTNTLVVGDKEDVLSRQMIVRQVSWVAGAAPELPREAQVKIRYKHKEAAAVIARSPDGWRPWRSVGQIASYQRMRKCVVRAFSIKIGKGPSPAAPRNDNSILIRFSEPQSAVTPGQAAVFYNGDVVLGGGVIDHVIG